METVRQCMRSRRYALSLRIMVAATVVVLTAQTKVECPPSTPPPSATLPPVCRWTTGEYSECSATYDGNQTRAVMCQCALPTGGTATVVNDVCNIMDPRMKPQTTRSCGVETRLLTAADVIAGGGEGECNWRTGSFGDCSETCKGVQTREVFCQCTLATAEQVRATRDNCVRDDLGTEPPTTRSCSIECPETRQTTDPSATPLRQQGQDNYHAHPDCRWTTGEYFECSATCEGTQRRLVFCQCTRPTGDSLVAFDDVCGSEDPRVKPTASQRCGGECPTDSSDGPLTINTVQPIDSGNRPIQTSSSNSTNSTSNRCNLTECDDQSDCDEDECCLEVTRKEDKRHGNHNYNSTTFCFPHVDENEACDLNGNWSCPCRDGLICTEGGRSRGKRKAKKKKDHSKDYRLTVTWEEGEECPTLYKKSNKKSNKKPSKDTPPTCQEESRRRSGRATNYDEEDEEEARPVAFGSHWD